MACSEVEDKFEENAKREGWEIHHGGWPDYILFKGEEVLVVEVKGTQYPLFEQQLRVLDLLASHGFEVRVSEDGTLAGLLTLTEYLEKQSRKGRKKAKPYTPSGKRPLPRVVRSILDDEVVRRFKEKKKGKEKRVFDDPSEI